MSDSRNIKSWSYHHLTINMTDAGDTLDATGVSPLTITGNFTITQGVFSAPASMTVTGDWSNSGTFTHNSGKVVLDGLSQEILGSTTFFNFTKNVSSAATLTFPAGESYLQTFAGEMDLKGQSGAYLSLRSATNGIQARIDAQGTRDIQYLDVKDNNNINATSITTAGLNIIDSGNNTGWTFNQDPTAPTSLGPSNLVDGGSTTDTTPTLTFTLSDPDSGEQVKFKIQIDDTSDFSSPVVDYTSALGSQGSSSFSVGQAESGGSYTAGFEGQTLEVGSYYWRIKTIDANSAESSYSTANSGSVAFQIVAPTSTPTATPIPMSPAEAPICTDTRPGSAPWLYGASVRGSDSILLQFHEASDPVSEYVVEYGTESRNYKFAMANIGEKGTTSYLVQNLSPNTTYYFRVRAGNGCAVGDWSNEISAKTLSSYSFFTGEELDIEIIDTEITEKETPNTYTVKEGDSLYSIAQNLFGKPNLYTRLIELNKDNYPSLKTNPSYLKVGWVLVLPTDEELMKEKERKEEVSGVDVRIKIVDERKNPVEGAKVTLYSEPRSAITNKDGVALFDNVETGEHQVVIAYKDKSGEQTINIKDTGVEEVDFTIQIKSTSPFKDPKVLAVIGALTVSLIVAIGIIIKHSK